MHYGSVEVGQVIYGNVEIGQAWTHSDGSWHHVFSATGPIPSIHAQNTAVQTAPRNTWTTVTWESVQGGVAPGGVFEIDGEGLAEIRGLTHTLAGITNQMRFRRMVNGVQVGAEISTASATTGNTETELPLIMVPLAPGDRVWLEMYAPSFSSARRELRANSWMSINPAE